MCLSPADTASAGSGLVIVNVDMKKETEGLKKHMWGRKWQGVTSGRRILVCLPFQDCVYGSVKFLAPRLMQE